MSSFPANANSNVVLPEVGGPNSNVILQNRITQFSSCMLFGVGHEKKMERGEFDRNDHLDSTICSPSRLDDSTDIMKNWQWFLRTSKNMKITKKTLYRSKNRQDKRLRIQRNLILHYEYKNSKD